MRNSIEQIVNEHVGNIDGVVTCALHTTFLASLSAFSLKNEALAEAIHELQPKMIDAYVPKYVLGVATFCDLIMRNHLADTTAPGKPVKALIASLIVNLEYALASTKRINLDSNIPIALEGFLKGIRETIPPSILDEVESDCTKILTEALEQDLEKSGR